MKKEILEKDSPNSMIAGERLIVDDAGLRLINVAGYLEGSGPTLRRTKAAGIYLERLVGDKWEPIEGPFWGFGTWPEEALAALRKACDDAGSLP